MISANVVSLAPLNMMKKRLEQYANLDFAPLMQEWREIIVEDNRKGVLEGTDGWGRKAPPLAYRNGGGSRTRARAGDERGVTEKRFKGRSAYMWSNPKWRERRIRGKHTKRVRVKDDPGYNRPIRLAVARKPSGKSRRPGAVILPNNNLSTTAYKRLTGPRLAPRREASRVITNFKVLYGKKGNVWYAQGAWDQVLDVNGKPFLQYHFEGEGVPKYDLRNIRPWGQKEFREALRRFLDGAIQKIRRGDFSTQYGQKRV